jgi:hypothetical protein
VAPAPQALAHLGFGELAAREHPHRVAVGGVSFQIG